MRQQVRAHLARFHAVAGDLHLLVAPADEAQRPGRIHADPVAGAIAAPRAVNLDEAPRRQVRIAEIATGDRGSAHDQLTVPARGQWHDLVAIVDAQVDAVHGEADRHVARLTHIRGVDLVIRHRDGGFGGAVPVEQPDPGQCLPHAARQRARQPVAAADHVAQAGRPGERRLGQQQRKHGGRQADGDDVLLDQRPDDSPRVEVRAFVEENHGGPGGQRPEEVGHGRVEGDGSQLEQPFAGRERELRAQPGDVPGEVAVLDDHAARAPVEPEV